MQTIYTHKPFDCRYCTPLPPPTHAYTHTTHTSNAKPRTQWSWRSRASHKSNTHTPHTQTHQRTTHASYTPNTTTPFSLLFESLLTALNPREVDHRRHYFRTRRSHFSQRSPHSRSNSQEASRRCSTLEYTYWRLIFSTHKIRSMHAQSGTPKTKTRFFFFFHFRGR